MSLHKLLFFFLLFYISNASAQKVTLEITSMRLPVPYVKVIDSVNGIIATSDSSGRVNLKKGNCVLTLSHVSFKEIKMFIPNPIKDTIINMLKRNRT